MTTHTLTNITAFPIRAQFAGLPQLLPGASFQVEDVDLRPIHIQLVQGGKLSASPAIAQRIIDNVASQPQAPTLVDADKVDFVPGVPGHWDTPPVSAAEALDRLAADVDAIAPGGAPATPGTVEAEKATIPDADKDLFGFRDVSMRRAGIIDAGGDHKVDILSAGNEAADRELAIPLLGGNDTLMTLATAQTVTGLKTMSGAGLTAGSVPTSALEDGAGLAALVAAGGGTSKAYAKDADTAGATDPTVVEAVVTGDRVALVIVTVTEAFSDGDDGAHPTFALSIQDGATFMANTVIDDVSGVLGAQFLFAVTIPDTKELLITAVPATPATNTLEAGAISVVVLALPALA